MTFELHPALIAPEITRNGPLDTSRTLSRRLHMLRIKLLAVASGLALSAWLLPATGALAATSPSSTMVFVGHDVTRQLDYTITYTDYSSTGAVLWSKTSPAPLGSLILVHEVPLSKAVSNGQTYVLAHGTPTQQKAEISNLHQKIAQSVDPGMTSNSTQSAAPSISPDSTMVATGSFKTYHNAYADYSISYNNDTANGTLNVTHYSLWLSSSPSSTLYWNWINWANNGYVPGCPVVGLSTSKDSVSLAWNGGTGNKFTTDINDSSSCNDILGTDYQGWVVLN